MFIHNVFNDVRGPLYILLWKEEERKIKRPHSKSTPSLVAYTIITHLLKNEMLNCVKTFTVSWLLAPIVFWVCGEFNFFFALWWVSLGEEAFSGSVLNSLWTCCVANNWLEVWSSPRGSWSTRRRTMITLHHSMSCKKYPLAVNKCHFIIGMTWLQDKLVLVRLSLIMHFPERRKAM